MKSNTLKILVILLLIPCGCHKDGAKGNIFKDDTIKEIYTLQDNRDSAGLKSYFNNENPDYRKYAALAFASVQDKKMVNELTVLLSDEDENVRSAAAYALGQTGDKNGEKGLLKRFNSESTEKVKMVILEALGRCGDEHSLELLGTPALAGRSQILMKGQALGIYRAVLRKKYTESGLKTVVRTLLKNGSDDVRFYCSNILSRIREVDLSEYFSELTELIKMEKNRAVKMNLIAALGKCRGADVISYLKTIIEEETDEKIIVNCIRALGEFDYNETGDELLKLAGDKNYHVSVTASEVLMKKGSVEEWKVYFETAKKSVHSRTAANLFKMSLKFSPEKPETSSIIKNSYKKSADPYYKGALLTALGEDPDNYPFIEEALFSSTSKIISTSGMISLSKIISDKEIDPEKKVVGGKGNHTLGEVFADIFIRGIKTGDSSLITISTGALRDPKNKFRDVITDLKFLENAITEYQGPGKNRILAELGQTLDFFQLKEQKNEKAEPVNKALDWDKIVSIPGDQKIKIITGEGEILIKLFVNESPGSVSNFLDLIETGYLKESAFHRVVPNFVIQDGCPRGDGWGGPDATIRSEFSYPYYEEGSLGMASAGKDTEGSQWFITHSSTPHLDGRYTIFGKVEAGMDVVNRIRVGTAVLSYKVLK